MVEIHFLFFFSFKSIYIYPETPILLPRVFAQMRGQTFQPSRFPDFYHILPICHEILKTRKKLLNYFFGRSECKTVTYYTFLSYNFSPSLSIKQPVLYRLKRPTVLLHLYSRPLYRLAPSALTNTNTHCFPS